MMEENFEVIGGSDAAKLLREQIRIVAPTSAAILIFGENGTGREAVAHEIHRYSSRNGKPFVVINCASIPEELLESEIFGYEKGAFAGASSQRKGKLDFADEGTLFLEEIADLPLNAQFKLQRVIEEQKFERMGGSKAIDVNVRIMASTSRHLEDGIKSGTFSDSLYYLLNVVPFDLLPLRERKTDIPALVEHFLEQFCRREMREKKSIEAVAVALMERYDWPGNIREMRNIMERLVIMTPGRIISVEQLPDMILEGSAFSSRLGGGTEPVGESRSLREAREEFEREFIINKLDENDWNVTRTAEAIELERSNLHRKIKSYGIDMKK